MLAAAARPDTIGEPAGQPLSQRVLAGDNRSEAQRRADFLAVYRYLFICDILASEVCPLEVAPDADMFEIRSAFRLKGASFPFFRRVRVCGTVVNSKEEGNVLRVTMDDMTGCLDVRLAKRSIHPKRLAEIAKGALVEFLGDLQIQGSSKVVESSMWVFGKNNVAGYRH